MTIIKNKTKKLIGSFVVVMTLAATTTLINAHEDVDIDKFTYDGVSLISRKGSKEYENVKEEGKIQDANTTEDNILINDTNNKVGSKEELINILTSQIKNRSKEIEIKYLGEDIKTGKDVNEIIIPIHRAGNYNIANIHSWSTSVTDSGSNKTIRMYPIYRNTDEEEEYVESEVERISQNLISSEMSDFDKVKILHDYLVDNKVYNSNTIGHSGSAYTLFNEGGGVCNAYALALSKLLDYNNIENYYIVGDSKHIDDVSWGLHAWNMVKVDGEWFNIDSTWNLPKSEYGLHNAYNYFLVSDERFGKTHQAHYNHLLPAANSKKYQGMYDGNFTK